MEHHFAPDQPFDRPIEENWTLGELLDSIAEADAPDDRMHPALVRLDRAIAERTDGPRWCRTPSAVALVRSICAACAESPELRRLGLAALLEGADVRVAMSA